MNTGISDCAVVLQCDEVCLQDVAQYTCTIDGNLLTWSVPNLMNSGDPHALQIGVKESVTDPTNTFTALLTDNSNNQLISTLSFMTTIQLSNEVIVCIAHSMTDMCSIMVTEGETKCESNYNLLCISTHQKYHLFL